MSKVPLAMIKCTKRHGGWVYRKFGKWQQNYVPDVTLETQGHVGIALGGRFATNTVDCWVESNVHVLNAPGLQRTEYAMITEVDPAATTEPDMTRIGVPMSLQSTFPATTSENGMKMTGGESGDGQSEGGDSEFGKSHV